MSAQPDQTQAPPAPATQTSDAGAQEPPLETTKAGGTVPFYHRHGAGGAAGFHGLPNVWRWQAKDKDGKLVEFAPGCPYAEFRGPTDRESVIAHATGYLQSARVEATTNGVEDPGYELDLDSVTPVGNNESAMGGWKPRNAKPVTLGVGTSYPEPPADDE